MWVLGSQQRLDALGELGVFPGVADDDFDCYTRLVTRLLDVPVALVSLVTSDRQFFPSSIGLAEPWATRGQTPLTMSFCQRVVVDDDLLVVADARADPRVCDNLAIDALGVEAYLGTPLRAPGGEPLGSLCAIDSRPRTWTDDDVARLQDVATAVSAAIALRVSEHRQRLAAAEASHELRTPIAAMRLELEDMAEWPQVTEEVRRGLRTVAGHVVRLAGVVDDLLERAPDTGRLRDAEVDVVELAAAAVARWQPVAGLQQRQVVLEEGGPVVVRTTVPVLRHVLDALVDDAVSHGRGTVVVQVEANDGVCRIRVADDTGAIAGGGAPDQRNGAIHWTSADDLIRRIGGRSSVVLGPRSSFELALPLGPGPG
jgi:signal transduction histidine kinase